MKLRNRVNLELANIEWANAMAEEHHYLHRAVHYRAHPFAYAVTLDGKTCGVIVVATPHFTRQRGLFGYDTVSIYRDGELLSSEEVDKKEAGETVKLLETWCMNHPGHEAVNTCHLSSPCS